MVAQNPDAKIQTVFIAEDAPDTRLILERQLRQWGYHVQMAADGTEALRTLEQSDAPSLALLDWMMPGLTGVEVVSALRAKGQSRPMHLIMMTGRDEADDIVMAMREGADDYILKPVNPDQLKAKIDRGFRHLETQIALANERWNNAKNARLASLGGIAAGVAHEINNPLTIVLGHLQMALMQLRNPTVPREDLVDRLTKAEAQATRMSKIVSGLVRFAGESGGETFAPSDLRLVIQAALGLCRERFQSHQIQLEVTGLEKPVFAECQSSAMTHVLTHLLNNSFDAVQKSSKRWVKLDLWEDSHRVEFRVSDSGPGIPDEIRGRLMEPFMTTKEVGQGTGLGLAVSSGILSAHNGILELLPRSTHTEFRASFPKKRSSESKAA